MKKTINQANTPARAGSLFLFSSSSFSPSIYFRRLEDENDRQLGFFFSRSTFPHA
jgi:hypothetical protein